MLGSVTAEHIPHNQISNYIENGADRSYVNHKTAQVGRIPFTRFLQKLRVHPVEWNGCLRYVIK